MNILWFSWKDNKHPKAGGAEVVKEQLARRLAADGHKVTLVVGGFAGAKTQESVDGYDIVRLGNRYTVYWQAYRYYRKHLRGWADLTIDEVNTLPFMAKYYVHGHSVLFVHQLSREIWFYQLPKYIGWIGYVLLEPLYLRLLRDRTAITVSNSTKHDLMRYGFKDSNIHIISEGITMKPVDDLDSIAKYDKPTVLSLGSIRHMKRTLHQIKAFEIAKAQIPDLQMIIAGDSNAPYGKKVLKYIANSRYAADIDYRGRVNDADKAELMQKSHVIAVTSVREGWGLIVTEANSQGTPAVVYDVAGLRDSVRHGETGVVEKRSPAGLAKGIVALLTDRDEYDRIRRNAYEWSKKITFETSIKDFCRGLSI